MVPADSDQTVCGGPVKVRCHMTALSPPRSPTLADAGGSLSQPSGRRTSRLLPPLATIAFRPRRCLRTDPLTGAAGMEIVGVGTEIVECLRVGRMIEQHGEQFLTRIYTAREISD